MPVRNLENSVEMIVVEKSTGRTGVMITVGLRDVLRLLVKQESFVVRLDEFTGLGANPIQDVAIAFIEDGALLQKKLVEKAQQDPNVEIAENPIGDTPPWKH